MIRHTGNKLVEVIDELNICGCGNPELVYKLIHDTMKEISENGVCLDATNYYYFMIYQLNHMGFLDHGSSIYGSWVTDKGKDLIKALEEMRKFDYNYQNFYEDNFLAGSF